ncbi:MAG: cyclic pyranopterin monophosphate synthase MoaC [Aquisalinus sp.]|nr:cyclic pyranopterin monophosphate synthase MoaC [Aquisalinus sp.]
MSGHLTHFDKQGRPQMVDVSQKEDTSRLAIAQGQVRFSPAAYEKIQTTGSHKGDIKVISELAGIMGGKRTSELIPLCHPLPLTGLNVAVTPADDTFSFIVTAEVKTTGKTGVEMEALTAVAIACLTIYDMGKAIDKGITIEKVQLLEKSGGKSGNFKRQKEAS